jgi:hypothetical protein
MIEITFKDENGNKLEQTLKIDADFIIRNEYLKDYLIDNFIEDNDECVCSLNESQSHCECGGIFGDGIEINTIEDI